MNSSLKRLMAACIVAICLVSIYSNSLAGNYTWTGTTNKNWTQNTNWTPNGIPSTNDTVNIGTGSDTILLTGNTIVTRFVMTGRVVNLADYRLEVSQQSTLSGGYIYNGTLKLRGSVATFTGTHTNCTIDCIAGQVQFNGGIFDGETSFEQNGTTNGFGTGGCVFNAPAVIKKSTNATLRMGQALPDTFNSRVDFICVNKVPLEISYGSSSVFNDLVSLSCVGANSEINIGNGTDTVRFMGDAALATGAEGLNEGAVILKKIVQYGQVDNELNADDGLTISAEGCRFTGRTVLSAPSILLKNTVFMGETALTKLRGNSNNYSYGGNTFYGNVTIENQDATYAFRFANNAGDNFYGNIAFVETSNRVQMAYSGTTRVEGDVSINSRDVSFNMGSGKVLLAGSNHQTLDGTDPYLFCKLEVNKDAGVIQFNQQATIDSALTFVSGIINTDSVITLKATTTCSGASNQSFVDGPVKKIGNTGFVFPVGDEGYYYPAEISAPSSLSDAFQCQYFSEYHGQSDTTDVEISGLSQCQFWKLERKSGSSSVNMTLFWDSLGCGLLDTSGLVVANWNGTIWKNLGRSSFSGNAFRGSIRNSTSIIDYSLFTLGSTAVLVMLTPTLDNPKTRSMPEDFYGYNGNNTIKSDEAGVNLQNWEMIRDNDANSGNTKKYLLDKYITLMRVPAGTFSNYSDWRTGYPIYEKDLPFGWKYRQNQYAKLMNRNGNELQFVRDNLSKISARPIIALNLLSSKFHYELASLYRLSELNLPIKYIELGNEFYLSNDQYFEVFPGVDDYITMAIDWADNIKLIPAFSGSKIAIVGALASTGNAGRQRLWLDQILSRIKGVNSIDAITLHNYLRNNTTGNNCVGTFSNADIESFLITAFDNAYELQHDELFKIRLFNQNSASPKEVWITEYNIDDDLDVRTGTWSHGILNAITALKYLESIDITKAISHTMLSGAKYGNIFENDDAFRFIKCHGLPMDSNPNQAGNITTAPIEKSALGTALDAVAYVSRGSVSATQILFNGANKLATSNYDELYGWKFEDGNGNINSIFINAGTSGYYLNLSNIYSSVITSQFIARRISAFNNSYVITHDAVNTIPQPNSMQYLYFTDNPWKTVGGTSLLFVPAYSMVVLKPIPSNGQLTARLSDDTICEGTTAMLTIESTSTVTPTPSASSANLNLIEQVNDRYIFSVNPTAAGLITISPCSNCSTLQLQVYPKLSAVTITGPTTYCPGSASIELEAGFTAGTGGSNTYTYSYLWAPDSGLVSSTCNNTPMCKKIKIEPSRTTIYTAYVTDGQCWASQDHLVTVPINKLDLGSDIQVCAGGNDTITLNSTYLDPDPSTTPTSYSWSTGASGVSTTIIPTSNLSVALTITDQSCTTTDNIQIKIVNCCTGTTGDAVVEPSTHSFTNNISNANYITVQQLADSCSSAGGFTCIFLDKDGLPTSAAFKIASVEINGSSAPGKTIFINGELRIQDDFYDDPANATPDINGMGLILKNCNIKFAENAGINIEYGQLKLENCTLQACSTFMWKGIYGPGQGAKDHLKVEITDCIIKDAIRSFDLKNDVPFSFSNNVFENNYSDVQLTNYFQTIPADVFINNQFKATTLLTPYSGQQKFAAIELVNVKYITIGEDVSGSENEFSNSLYGLKSENSSFTLLNNLFSQIGDFTSSTIPGAGVSASSAFDYSDREIKIGNGTNVGENIFESSTNGVTIDGETHFYVKNNVFGNPNSYSDKIRDYCIKAENIGKMNLEISGINTFYDYKYGVWLFNSKPYKSFIVSNNDFYNFDVNIASTLNHEGTAITVLQPFLTTVPGAEISGNKIGRFNITQTQPRNGIVVSMMKNIKVSQNTIKFKVSTIPPAFNYSGIWMQQCNYARIYDNEITNTPSNFPAGVGFSLIGVDMNDCNNTCIEESKINKMGVGMRFTGNSYVQSLYANEISNYDSAYFLENAYIGSSVGRSNPPIVMNNKWTRTGSTGLSITSGRVEGSVQGGVPIDWYYQSSANDEYTPTGLVVSATLLSSYASQSLCPPSTKYIDFDNPPYNANLRNADFGPIVGDSARFPEEFNSNFRVLARSSLYLTLKQNPELLSMGDQADEAFVDFYNSMSDYNVQLFDSVMTLIQEEKFDEAQALNESIEDSIALDEKLKVSLRMYLKTMQPDSMLSASDTAQLFEIAYLNPLYFGTGVYIARNLLNLEIHDDNSGSYRLMSTKVEKRPFSAYIQPNPAKDYISIICSDGDTPDRIRIQSIEGKNIDLPIENLRVDISQLPPGMYLCTVSKYGSTIVNKFIKL